MSAYLFSPASISPSSRYAHDKQENLLAASTEELASLRFSIILTARWEAAASEDEERRDELRAELVELRRAYSEKIDDIAMTFGVQSAIDAKEEVERTVAVPVGMDLPKTPAEDDYLYF